MQSPIRETVIIRDERFLLYIKSDLCRSVSKTKPVQTYSDLGWRYDYPESNMLKEAK